MIELIDPNKKEESIDVYKKHLIPHSEINKDIEDYISGKIPQGFASNSTNLNQHYLFKKNEFYLCTGRKGEGKTTINQTLQIFGSVVMI